MVVRNWCIACALVASACAEPERDTTYAERRVAPALAEPVLSISDAQRFGARGPSTRPNASSGSTQSSPESPLSWESPPGWEERPSSSMRLANYSVGADAECYLTILPGTGGGVVGNVNRWREQIGLEAVSAEEVAALPRISLLGTEAYLVELEGAFKGMGTEAKEGWGLRGAILGTDRFTIFVKFTGPAELVSLEAESFDAFCASITIREQATSSASSSTSSSSTSHGSASGIGWEAPPEWVMEPGGGMRLVTFRRGGVELYLTVLGGDGGGVVPNIQRWVEQLGLTPPTAAEVAALPKVEVMGVPSPLLEATGEYTGMGASGAIPDTTMYGIVCLLPERAVFVKMLGPSAEVLAERERFTAFVASMHSEDSH